MNTKPPMPKLCVYVLVFAMLASQLQISGVWSTLQQNPALARVIGLDKAEAQSLPPTFSLNGTDVVRAFANQHGANIPTAFENMGQVRLDPPTLFKLCNLAGYSGVQSYACTYGGENRCNFTSCGNNTLHGWNGSSWVAGGACGGAWIAQMTCNTPFVACNDGKDNDGDGKIDLQDPGCTSATDTDETDPLAQCQDGIDNDGDGRTDYPADPGCSSPTDSNEGDDPACSDRRDNDGDGLTDYPQDPGCADPTDQDEFNQPPPPACSDGQDNDGDNLADFPNDPGCTGLTDNDEFNNDVPECSDRLDNDGDGKIDYNGGQLYTATPITLNATSAGFQRTFNVTAGQGFSVTGVHGSFSTGGGTYVQCNVANSNGNYIVTFANSNGQTISTHTVPSLVTGVIVPTGATQARVNFYDVGNNYADNAGSCTMTINQSTGSMPADPGCTGPTDDDERDALPQCQDGIDNDGDGVTDFPQDFSCSSPTDTDETNPKAACQDGADNDQDGLVDFPQDPGCASRQDNDESNTVGRVCTAAEVAAYRIPGQEKIYAVKTTTSNGGFSVVNQTECILPITATSFKTVGSTWNQFVYANTNHTVSPFSTQNFNIAVPPNCGYWYGVSYGTHNVPVGSTLGQWNTITNGWNHAANVTANFIAGWVVEPSCAQSQPPPPAPREQNLPGRPLCSLQQTNQYIAQGLMTISHEGSFWRVHMDTSITCGVPLNWASFKKDNTSSLFYYDNGYAYGHVFDTTMYIGHAPACGYDDYLAYGNYNLTAGMSVNDYKNTTNFAVNGLDNQSFGNSCATAQCQDGVDNDNDGSTDFPNDFSCSSPTDTDETNPKSQCQDGFDNDQDGLVDFPQDPGCTSRQDNDEFNAPTPACRDGLDNDFDGRIDMQDPGCSNPDDTNEGDEVACNDRIDNDNDGLIDFPFDPGCSSLTDTDEFNQAQTVDLSILKTGQTSVTRGQTLFYTLTVGNAGSVQATNVVVTDQIPAGLTYNDGLSYGPCSQQGNAVVCSIGTLVANQFGSFLIAFDVPTIQNCTTANVVNAATIAGTQQDSNQGNNTASTQASPTRIDCPVVQTQCQDGIDNDQDGRVDFPNDPGCSSPTDTNEGDEAACQDRRDNDQDGLVDWPLDPGCTGPTDSDEYNAPLTQCSDGIDNDGDGRADMLDPGCSSPTDTNEGDETACQDRRDNDFDGLVDFPQDPGCSSPTDTDEFNQPQTQCSDGVDNDGDGRADMLDPGCSGPTDTNEGDEAACQDRRDNDNDGLTDWPQDPGCTGPTDSDEYNAPLTQCSDGIDNDGDWRVDLLDPGCSGPNDTNEGDDPACFDRVDNDNDGRIDFPLDPGCSSPTDTDESDPFVAQCQDGRDNDFDGKVDMQDPGCSNAQDNNEGDDPTTQYGCIEILKETFDPTGDRLPVAAQFTFILDATRVAYNDAQGRARYDQVTVGQHAVAEIIPSGWAQFLVTPSNGVVNVTAGSNCAAVVFKNKQVFVSNAQCSDGFDNDGDGKKDFPQDNGCTSATDDDEYDSSFRPQCQDGIDNDGDGKVDFPLDQGCASFDDNNEQNQVNQLQQPIVQSPTPTPTPTPAPIVNVPQTGAACSDGIDNDGDGKVDMQDGGCSGAQDNDEFNFRAARCSDGVDNDGDGLKDHPQDPGCTTPYDDNEHNDRLVIDRWREFWNWNW